MNDNDKDKPFNPNFIFSINYLGIDQILVKDNGIPVKMNEVISDEKAIITGGRAPHKSSSQGFVFIKDNPEYITTEYYPSVFNLKWVDLLIND